MWGPCLITLRLRVFCDINSTSSGPPVPFEGSRQAIFSGIHRRCHRAKACPSFLCQKIKKGGSGILLAATAYGELSQFLCLYIKCVAFQVKPFVACTTCDLGSSVATQTLWLFDISSDKFLSLTLFFFFPFSSLPHRLISRHQAPPSSWQSFIGTFSTFPVSFNQQLSATSTLDALRATPSWIEAHSNTIYR